MSQAKAPARRDHCDVIVVGAGWAGLVAAHTVASCGLQVQVLEKSRGPGGRCATRRQAPYHFDHGAQYFTARDEGFAAQVNQWQQQGLVAIWTPRLAVFNADGMCHQASSVTRWVGVPGNNAVLQHLSANLRCHYGTEVTSVAACDGGVEVRVGSQVLTAKAAVVTAPPAQAAGLLGHDHPAAAKLLAVDMAPCLALMIGVSADHDLGFDAAFINDHALSWLARMQSKPGRQAPGWVVHAGAEWSERHLEASKDGVAELMWAQLLDRVPAFGDLEVISRVGHRWRYSQCRQPLTEGCLSDPSGRLVVAGDWCAGNRIEGAWRSGQAAAQSVLNALT